VFGFKNVNTVAAVAAEYVDFDIDKGQVVVVVQWHVSQTSASASAQNPMWLAPRVSSSCGAAVGATLWRSLVQQRTIVTRAQANNDAAVH
jgi:hypothetical protein